MNKHPRGFATLPRAERREIASKGGRSAHAKGVAHEWTSEQARLAVDSRAFPLLIFDPRKGDKVKERLSLQGNPAVKEDWYANPKTKESVTFIDFARIALPLLLDDLEQLVEWLEAHDLDLETNVK